MTKEEYINKVLEFRKEFKDKMKELDELYIKELTSDVKIGDLVTSSNNNTNIIVDSIKPYKQDYIDEYDNEYHPNEDGYYFHEEIETPIPIFCGTRTKGDNGVPPKYPVKWHFSERYYYEVRKRHEDGLFHHEDYKTHNIPRN